MGSSASTGGNESGSVTASAPPPNAQRDGPRDLSVLDGALGSQPLRIPPPLLDWCANIYLAFAAEALGRIEGDGQVQGKYVDRLSPADKRAFQTRRRCSFSWMTDTTTLAVVRQGIAPNLEDGANALYNIVVAVVVLNSRARYEALAPLSLAAPITANDFKAKFEPLFGRRAPPGALLQAVRCTLGRYGAGNHFENSARFVEDMGGKCAAAWAKIDAARQVGGTSAAVLKVLRKDLGLGPFSSVVAARLLSVLDQRLFDCERADLGQYARMGLGLLAGMDSKRARELSTKKARAREANALFEQLREELPAAVRGPDDDCVMQRLHAYSLMPLAGQTLEHMLCETRKIMVPSGRERGGSRTAQDEYQALWQVARHLYSARAARLP